MIPKRRCAQKESGTEEVEKDWLYYRRLVLNPTKIIYKMLRNESQNCLYKGQRRNHLSVVSCSPLVKSGSMYMKLHHIFWLSLCECRGGSYWYNQRNLREGGRICKTPAKGRNCSIAPVWSQTKSECNWSLKQWLE